MKKTALLCAAVGFVVGCAQPPADEADETGNASLGVARFVIDESNRETTVVGFDTDGNEVARVELVHGAFAPSGEFVDEFDTDMVDGRSLKMSVGGFGFHWETAGYAATLEMPPITEHALPLKELIEDPHVKQILQRWLIGFTDSFETAYTHGNYAGSDYLQCNGAAVCGSTVNGTINMCGDSANAIKAASITQSTSCGGSGNWKFVSQDCPGESFSQKYCPTIAGQDGTPCGTRTTGACKGCGAITGISGAAIFTNNGPGTCAAPATLYWAYNERQVQLIAYGPGGTSPGCVHAASTGGTPVVGGSNLCGISYSWYTAVPNGATIGASGSGYACTTHITGACTATSTFGGSIGCPYTVTADTSVTLDCH